MPNFAVRQSQATLHVSADATRIRDLPEHGTSATNPLTSELDMNGFRAVDALSYAVQGASGTHLTEGGGVGQLNTSGAMLVDAGAGQGVTLGVNGTGIATAGPTAFTLFATFDANGNQLDNVATIIGTGVGALTLQSAATQNVLVDTTGAGQQVSLATNAVGRFVVTDTNLRCFVPLDVNFNALQNVPSMVGPAAANMTVQSATDLELDAVAGDVLLQTGGTTRVGVTGTGVGLTVPLDVAGNNITDALAVIGQNNIDVTLQSQGSGKVVVDAPGSTIELAVGAAVEVTVNSDGMSLAAGNGIAFAGPQAARFPQNEMRHYSSGADAAVPTSGLAAPYTIPVEITRIGNVVTCRLGFDNTVQTNDVTANFAVNLSAGAYGNTWAGNYAPRTAEHLGTFTIAENGAGASRAFNIDGTNLTVELGAGLTFQSGPITVTWCP